MPRSLPRDLRVGRVDPTREAGDFPEDSGIGRWAARGGGDTLWFWAPGTGRCSQWGGTATSTSESLRLGPWLPLSPQTNPSWFIPPAGRTQADSEGPGPSGHAGASWRKDLCNPALRDGVWGLGQRLPGVQGESRCLPGPAVWNCGVLTPSVWGETVLCYVNTPSPCCCLALSHARRGMFRCLFPGSLRDFAAVSFWPGGSVLLQRGALVRDAGSAASSPTSEQACWEWFHLEGEEGTADGRWPHTRALHSSGPQS